MSNTINYLSCTIPIWTLDLSVGVDCLDEDIKALLRLVAVFRDILIDPSEDRDVLTETILDMIGEYARSHFHREEKALAAVNYPELAPHVEAHNQFISHLDRVTQDYKGGDKGAAAQVPELLCRWYPDHIKTMDMRFRGILTNGNVDYRPLATVLQSVNLERQRALLCAIVTSSDDAIVSKTLGGIITSWNPAAERLFGYGAVEVIGKPITMLFPQDRLGEEGALMARLARDEVVQGFETERVRKDGSAVNVSITLSPIRDQHGQVIGASKIVHDISRRLKAESDLRIADAAFDAAEPIMITDRNGVILRVNSAFSETTGYSADEAVGQTPSLLKSERHDAAFYAEMWATVQKTGFWQGEIWDRRKNGEVYPKWLSTRTVTGAEGAITHYVACFADISERKSNEDRISELAFYDPLTRLPNRRLLLDRLQQALSSSARNGLDGSLLFIDLDNFKRLNDTKGHDKGDQLLEQIALRLVPCVRESDTVARLGGDEFVVVLGNLSPIPEEAAAYAKSVGEKILAAIGRDFQFSRHECRVTASVGIAMFGANGLDMMELLKQADIAMYTLSTP